MKDSGFNFFCFIIFSLTAAINLILMLALSISNHLALVKYFGLLAIVSTSIAMFNYVVGLKNQKIEHIRR